MTPTAVVADDDLLARERLKDLNAEAGLFELVGEAADGHTAVTLIDDIKPDIAFLDIEMPGITGLKVLERITHRPAVIFTTAYTNYAVRAFDLAAIDYLLKPFGIERLTEAVERVGGEAGANVELLERARIALNASDERLERIFIRERDSIIPLLVADIVRFEADGDYVHVHTAKQRHMVRARLQDLQEELGAEFVRVHRSHLVNLDRVVRFEPHDASRLVAVMEDGSRVVASRSRSQGLRQLAR